MFGELRFWLQISANAEFSICSLVVCILINACNKDEWLLMLLYVCVTESKQMRSEWSLATIVSSWHLYSISKLKSLKSTECGSDGSELCKSVVRRFGVQNGLKQVEYDSNSLCQKQAILALSV